MLYTVTFDSSNEDNAISPIPYKQTRSRTRKQPDKVVQKTEKQTNENEIDHVKIVVRKGGETTSFEDGKGENIMDKGKRNKKLKTIPVPPEATPIKEGGTDVKVDKKVQRSRNIKKYEDNSTSITSSCSLTECSSDDYSSKSNAHNLSVCSSCSNSKEAHTDDISDIIEDSPASRRKARNSQLKSPRRLSYSITTSSSFLNSTDGSLYSGSIHNSCHSSKGSSIYNANAYSPFQSPHEGPMYNVNAYRSHHNSAMSPLHNISANDSCGKSSKKLNDNANDNSAHDNILKSPSRKSNPYNSYHSLSKSSSLGLNPQNSCHNSSKSSLHGLDLFSSPKGPLHDKNPFSSYHSALKNSAYSSYHNSLSSRAYSLSELSSIDISTESLSMHKLYSQTSRCNATGLNSGHSLLSKSGEQASQLDSERSSVSMNDTYESDNGEYIDIESIFRNYREEAILRRMASNLTCYRMKIEKTTTWKGFRHHFSFFSEGCEIFHSKIKSRKFIEFIPICSGAECHYQGKHDYVMLVDDKNSAFSLRAGDPHGKELMSIKYSVYSGSSKPRGCTVSLHGTENDVPNVVRSKSPVQTPTGNHILDAFGRTAMTSIKNCVLMDQDRIIHFILLKRAKTEMSIEADPMLDPIYSFALGISAYICKK